MPSAKTRKQQSKEKILQAAARLFCRYGFEKVSIGQIMREVKMTHGAFYAHFASKEALYRASLINLLKNARPARLIKAPLSGGQLVALIDSYWSLRNSKQAPDAPGPEAILFNEVGTPNARVQRLFRVSYESLRRLIENRMRALKRLYRERADAADDNVTERSRVVLGLLVGAVAIAKTIPNEDERRGILEAAQRQILTLMGVRQTIPANAAELAG